MTRSNLPANPSEVLSEKHLVALWRARDDILGKLPRVYQQMLADATDTDDLSLRLRAREQLLKHVNIWIEERDWKRRQGEAEDLLHSLDTSVILMIQEMQAQMKREARVASSCARVVDVEVRDPEGKDGQEDASTPSESDASDAIE